MKSKIIKIFNYIKNDIKKYYKTYIIYLLLLSSLFIEFDYYVYSNGGLIDLTDRIKVEDGYESDGSFNLTFVSSKKGIWPVLLLSYVIPSWDIEKISESQIENESAEEIIKRNQIYLKETSYDAVIAAFNEANISYNIEKVDVVVSHIFESADTDLIVGDIIKSIDGNNVDSYDSIINILSHYEANTKVNIEVLRDNKKINCYAKLYKNDDRVVVGMTLAELKEIDTNPKVEFIFKNSESGSSRGLMCALEIYNRITKYDITKGDTISGTGSIDDKGNIGTIDGVKYKLNGAVKKGANVFIVPTENYDEAIKIKKEKSYDIEIIKADNLHNVIEKLKNR